jgi:hypothetical protein
MGAPPRALIPMLLDRFWSMLTGRSGVLMSTDAAGVGGFLKPAFCQLGFIPAI